MWVPTYCDILKLIQDDESSEVILRVNFYKKALDVGTRGSLAMKSAFSEHTKALEEEPIDVFVPWMLEDDAEAKATRVRAAKLLEKLPSLELATVAAKEALEKEQKPLNAALEWRGVLRRAEKGEWRADGFEKIETSGGVFVVYEKGPDHEPTISRVANVERGRVTFLNTDETTFVEGRPLFFLPIGG